MQCTATGSASKANVCCVYSYIYYTEMGTFHVNREIREYSLTHDGPRLQSEVPLTSNSCEIPENILSHQVNCPTI